MQYVARYENLSYCCRTAAKIPGLLFLSFKVHFFAQVWLLYCRHKDNRQLMLKYSKKEAGNCCLCVTVMAIMNGRNQRLCKSQRLFELIVSSTVLQKDCLITMQYLLAQCVSKPQCSLIAHCAAK